MDIYLQIKDLEDEELKDFVEERIKKLEDKSLEDNNYSDTIGYKIDYNLTTKILTDINDKSDMDIIIRWLHYGYIKKNTRIVYGINSTGINGCLYGNSGNYYYVDDDSYILEFCKIIKNQEILDEYDFFEYVLDFIRLYFGSIELISREDMFKMIVNSSGRYYEPIKKHNLSDFKKKGNAMCSEYATLANNILSFFGFDIYYVIGETCATTLPPVKHAFNFMRFTEKQTGEEENILIDFMKSIPIVDIDGSMLSLSPYIGHIDEINDELISELSNDERRLIMSEYEYTKINDSLLQIAYPDIEREYYINQELGLKPKIYNKK